MRPPITLQHGLPAEETTMTRFLTKLFGTSETVRRPSHVALRVDPLEDRRMLDATMDPYGNLRIDGTPYNDVVQVTSPNPYRIDVSFNGTVRYFGAPIPGRILFLGGEGYDAFDSDVNGEVIAYGGPGNDELMGGPGVNRLYGEDGNDALNPEGSAHNLIGLEGMGVNGPTVADGGIGNDTVQGGSSSDTLTGGGGDDVLYGWSGSDVLMGDDGNDVLYGHDGNDSLYGGTGMDFLYGGRLNDYLDGGRDKDRDYLWGGNEGAAWETGDTFVRYLWNFTSTEQEDLFQDYSLPAGDRVEFVDLNVTSRGGGGIWSD
jgi:hypothetical protein